MAQSCCVTFAKFILIFINFIFFSMGAGIAGMAGYLLANGKSLGFDASTQAILSPTALYACIIFGSTILVVSLVGCVSAMKPGCCGKFFLSIYSTIIGIVILAELAGGAVVLAASGKLGAIGKTKVANTTTDAFEQAVETFIETTYTKCCPGGKINTNDVVCKLIQQGLTTSGSSNMCTTESGFRQACVKFLETYTKPIGVGAIIIAVIELLCIGAACHITCHALSPAQQEAKEIKKQQEQRAAGAGDLAYGGASGKPLAGGSYA